MTATAPPTAPPSEATRQALDALARLARVHDRADLADEAAGAARRLDGTRFTVAIVGEFKRGKSSLINALVDAPACAVDDDIATAARLEVGFADPAGARRWRRDPDAPERTVTDDLEPSAAAAASTDPTTTLVRLGLPRRLLATGLVLVDTPGVGGLGSATAVATASSLTDANAVLFVSDVSQELTRTELDALVDVSGRCANVLLVETKTDVYPRWREIVEADRAHLQRMDLDVPIVAVSSRVRTLAARRRDPALDDESGFRVLVELIRNRLLGEARERTADDALATARRVYAHLRTPLVEEIELLESPDTTAADAAIEESRHDIEAFRARVGSWQQTLTDGMVDLAAAVDVDLRDRFRTIVRDAEAELDEVDPDEVWHEFESDLYRRTAEALDANLTKLRVRADDLARRLADQVVADEAALVDLGLDVEADELAGGAERRDGTEASAGARAQQAFRAGYGGAMPIMAVGGMALGVLGLGTLVLPLAAVAGMMAGRRAVSDERERRLHQRRQHAKVAVKKYTDEALFRAAAERKRAQRQVQRTLRDHFARRVKELAVTRQQRLEHAESARSTAERDRRRRLADVTDELRRIEDVARRMGAPS